jgi:hypothetical protein
MTPTTVAESPALFQKAVDSLATRTSFMAHLFSLVFAGDISAKRIAAELNCSEVNALRLAMMRVPRSDRQQFRDDVSRIAQSAGVDRDRLLALIKQAQALAVFGEAEKGRGMLLAAQDRLPDRRNDRED